MSDAPDLIAYDTGDVTALSIEPAHVGRKWMSEVRDQFAKRCLPMLIANQAGWHIVTNVPVYARWNGGDGTSAVQVGSPVERPRHAAISHFGEGVLTWSIPWLFRTSPGWDLHVRGPANWPKDGIVALEGITETDTTNATFTMNWIFTAEHTTVHWDAGEPIALIAPIRRGALEEIEPCFGGRLGDEEAREYRAWSKSRDSFNAALHAGDPATKAKGWQKKYIREVDKTRLHLHPFTRHEESA